MFSNYLFIHHGCYPVEYSPGKLAYTVERSGALTIFNPYFPVLCFYLRFKSVLNKNW